MYLKNHKLTIYAALGLTGLLVVIWTILQLFTSTISVSTHDYASIYAKQGGTDFKKIGTGRAVLKTRNKEAVFIEARLNEQITQRSVIPQRRQTQQISLGLRPLVEPKSFAEGPVIYPLVDGQFIHGINPHTNSLTVKRLEGSDGTLPDVPLLPFLKQIIWFDRQNFLYITLGRGAGIYGNSTDHGHGSLSYSAAATNGSAIALLGTDGVYLAENRDLANAQKISSYIDNSAPNIFMSNDRIFRISLIYEPIVEEQDEPLGKETELLAFNLDGRREEEMRLPIKTPVRKMVTLENGELGLLSDEGLHFLKVGIGESNKKEFSFGKVQDFVEYKGHLLLLGESGLWEYNRSASEYYKLANYPMGEGYVPDSLTIFRNNLYFSTSNKAGGTSSRGKSTVYIINLE